jgi:hypothetical protein
MLIEELTPSTNYEYISSKYNNENKEECEQKLDTPIQRSLDTPSPSKIGYPLKKELDTPTPVQASSYIRLEEQGGIQAKLDTPPQLALDTNILSVLSSNHKTQFQQSRKFLSRISDNIK